MRGVGDTDYPVGLEGAQVTVGTGDAHVRVWRGFVDDVLHKVFVGNVGWDGGEDGAGLIGIALGEEVGGISQGLGGFGGVGFVREVQSGHALVEIRRWNALPAAVGWLRYLGIVHGVGVDIVNATHGGFAQFGELVVVGASPRLAWVQP